MQMLGEILTNPSGTMASGKACPPDLTAISSRKCQLIPLLLDMHKGKHSRTPPQPINLNWNTVIEEENTELSTFHLSNISAVISH